MLIIMKEKKGSLPITLTELAIDYRANQSAKDKFEIVFLPFTHRFCKKCHFFVRNSFVCVVPVHKAEAKTGTCNVLIAIKLIFSSFQMENFAEHVFSWLNTSCESDCYLHANKMKPHSSEEPFVW
jgi:hypothetical protein